MIRASPYDPKKTEFFDNPHNLSIFYQSFSDRREALHLMLFEYSCFVGLKMMFKMMLKTMFENMLKMIV